MIDVVNAASGAVVGQVPDMSADDVGKVVDRARRAQADWAGIGLRARRDILRAVRRAMARRRAEIRDVLIAESGKAWEDAQAGLVLTLSGLSHWETNSGDVLADERLSTGGIWGMGRSAFTTFRPHGVVGVIGPWNYPLGLTFGDAVPALLAGNTVVCKPSEITPLSTLWAAEVFAEIARQHGAPEDVLTVVTGRGSTGAALVDEVDMVQFTGSVGTGRRIAHACIDRDIPYCLEMGGKDPWIVLADADLGRAARAATHYGLYNGGQVCMSTERIYVESAVYDEFITLLTQRVRGLRTGPGDGPGTTDISPLVGPGQAEIVATHIRDALNKGARATTGGMPRDADAPRPTVLADVDHTMRCMTEETFGPTLPVMRVHDAEHAVALANDSVFGLTASIWTRDRRRGQQLARRINAGTISINDANLHLGMGHLPMTGVGASGTGTRNGVEGIRKYTRPTTVVTNRSPITREPTWLPYGRLAATVVDKAVGLLYGR